MSGLFRFLFPAKSQWLYLLRQLFSNPLCLISLVTHFLCVSFPFLTYMICYKYASLLQFRHIKFTEQSWIVVFHFNIMFIPRVFLCICVWIWLTKIQHISLHNNIIIIFNSVVLTVCNTSSNSHHYSSTFTSSFYYY